MKRRSQPGGQGVAQHWRLIAQPNEVWEPEPAFTRVPANDNSKRKRRANAPGGPDLRNRTTAQLSPATPTECTENLEEASAQHLRNTPQLCQRLRSPTVTYPRRDDPIDCETGFGWRRAAGEVALPANDKSRFAAADKSPAQSSVSDGQELDRRARCEALSVPRLLLADGAKPQGPRV